MPLARLVWYNPQTKTDHASRVVSFMTPVKITRFDHWLRAIHPLIVEVRDIFDRKGQPINGWYWDSPSTDHGHIVWCFDHKDAPGMILDINRAGGGMGR